MPGNLSWIKSREVYKRVPLKDCFERTKKRPISMKRIDADKGDEERPNYRSRLVCRELRREVKKAAKKPGEELRASELFSSMPPLEAIKMLCSLRVTLELSPKKKPLKLALWDISRAHLYGDAQRDLYVELPPEDAQRSWTATWNRCADCFSEACAALKKPRKFGRRTMPSCLEASTGSKPRELERSSLLRHRHPGTSCGAW
eukprot:2070039-Amphidinium_carterae.2